MSLSLRDSSKFTFTRVGFQLRGRVSFKEWAALAPKLSEVIQCAAFIIGDWLVLGESRFQKNSRTRVGSAAYEAAIAATGLDRSTLHSYAYVARRVVHSMRDTRLSWEHHRVVAKLAEGDQRKWLAEALPADDCSAPMSTRRLRKSIATGRVVEAQELRGDPVDRSFRTHIPFINRLVAWWSNIKQQGWLEGASMEERAALKRDLRPLVEIYQRL